MQMINFLLLFWEQNSTVAVVAVYLSNLSRKPVFVQLM